MRTEVTQGLQVLRGVRDFLAVTEIKPELGVIAKHVEELDAVIDRLTADGVSQERSDRARRSMTSAARLQARRQRRVFLQPVAGMGKKLFKNDPTLLRAVAMPSIGLVGHRMRGHDQPLVPPTFPFIPAVVAAPDGRLSRHGCRDWRLTSGCN